MVKSYKSNLLDLIDEIDWVAILPQRIARNPDGITCNFFQAPGDIKKNQVRVRLAFGINVVNSLSWKENDNIGICNKPDNVFNLRVFKREPTEKGFRLKKHTPGAAHEITFIWPYPKIKVPVKCKPFSVEFINHKNSYFVMDINPNHYLEENIDEYQAIG